MRTRDGSGFCKFGEIYEFEYLDRNRDIIHRDLREFCLILVQRCECKVKKMASSDSDVHISQENQKKINTFAVRNGWLEELETELKAKENDLKNLEDGETEVALLMDPVPILVGESFVHFEPDAAGEELQRRAVNTKADIKKLEGQITKIKNEMSALKAELYERFGDNINLENEDA